MSFHTTRHGYIFRDKNGAQRYKIQVDKTNYEQSRFDSSNTSMARSGETMRTNNGNPQIKTLGILQKIACKKLDTRNLILNEGAGRKFRDKESEGNLYNFDAEKNKY